MAVSCFPKTNRSHCFRSLRDLLHHCTHAFGRCSSAAAAVTLLYSLFRSRKMLSKHPLVCLLLAVPQVRANVPRESHPPVSLLLASPADSQERSLPRILLLPLHRSSMPPPAAPRAQACAMACANTAHPSLTRCAAAAGIGTRSLPAPSLPFPSSCFQRQPALPLLSMLQSGTAVLTGLHISHVPVLLFLIIRGAPLIPPFFNSGRSKSLAQLLPETLRPLPSRTGRTTTSSS